jgi:hypothetical protein
VCASTPLALPPLALLCRPLPCRLLQRRVAPFDTGFIQRKAASGRGASLPRAVASCQRGSERSESEFWSGGVREAHAYEEEFEKHTRMMYLCL